MPEVFTKEEVQELFSEVWQTIADLQQEIKSLKAARTVWIDLEEAIKLTGRSASWFYNRRLTGTLPIAMLPTDKGSSRLKYSEADCIAYGIKHRILPPNYGKEES